MYYTAVLHPTLVPPKKSSTHFYVNNRDPLCTKKVPLPSQQETAAAKPAGPDLPLLVLLAFLCRWAYNFFSTTREKSLSSHMSYFTQKKKRQPKPVAVASSSSMYSPSFLLYYIQMRGEKNYYFCARMVISLGFSWICEHVLSFYV